MTQKEMRLNRIDNLNQRMSKKYKSILIDDTICFIIKNGVYKIDSMGGDYNALVIEYADSLDMAKKGVFGEDGDLFYMDEFNEDQMYDQMIREIEEQ